MKYSDGTSYVGHWHEDLPCIYGKKEYPNGDVYEGEHANGYKKGNGTMRYANKDLFEGKWWADMKWCGLMIYADGKAKKWKAYKEM